jgi:3-deoxy-D-manno-octulosonate 8-phosphate phosphatase (KDO 8-P phosphatase)
LELELKTFEVKPGTQNSKLETEELIRRAKRIKLLLMDCDGVLTDARIWLTPEGDEQKAFHARDGQGISVWHRGGFRSGVISGRASSGVARRAHELKMHYVHQYAKDKIVAMEEIVGDAGVSVDECCYLGDDLGDVAVMRRVGLAVAVADAGAETKAAAHYITTLAGGAGAVREVIELILKAQDRWDELVAQVTSH